MTSSSAAGCRGLRRHDGARRCRTRRRDDSDRDPTPVYDLTREVVYRRPAGGVLEIPPGAVVVPGARAARGQFAADQGLSLYTPVIVKYRDATTDAATLLETALR